jgi:hypothetical protein
MIAAKQFQSIEEIQGWVAQRLKESDGEAEAECLALVAGLGEGVQADVAGRAQKARLKRRAREAADFRDRLEAATAAGAVRERDWAELGVPTSLFSGSNTQDEHNRPEESKTEELIAELRAIDSETYGVEVLVVLLERCWDAVAAARLSREEAKEVIEERGEGLFDEFWVRREATGAWAEPEVLPPEPGVPVAGQLYKIDTEDFSGTSAKYLSVVDRKGVRTLHRWWGSFWDWRETHYGEADDERIRNALYQYLKRCVVMQWGKGKLEPVEVLPNKNMINNMLDALKSEAFLPPELEMPTWLVHRLLIYARF